MPRYKIEIIEIGQETRTLGKSWKRGAGETPDDYGYTPETEATCDYEREIYAQFVDTIDLPKVIAAVNNLSS